MGQVKYLAFFCLRGYAAKLDLQHIITFVPGILKDIMPYHGNVLIPDCIGIHLATEKKDAPPIY
jgi:hypothetical protein